MQMDLEPVILSEVSKKEEDNYRILMHIYGIQKNDTDEPICRAGIDTDIENGHMDPAGEGWGGTNWETAP